MNQSSNAITVATLLLTVVTDIMGMGLVFPVLPTIFSSATNPFHLNDNNLFMLYCITMMIVPIGWSISGVIMGKLSDVLGRKKVILISLIASTLSYGFCVMALNTHLLTLFIFARLIIGLGSGSYSLVQTVMTDIAPEGKLGKYMGWVNAASAIGFVMGALLTMFFSFVYGANENYYIFPFYGGFILCLTNTILVYLFISETHQPKSSRTIKLFDFNISKELTYLLILFSQLEIAWGIFLQTSPIMLDHIYFASSYEISVYYFLNGLCAVLCIFFVQPWFEKHFSYEKATYGLALITAFFMVLLSVKTNFITFTVLMFLMTFFEFLLYISLLVQITKNSPEGSRGMVMGMVSSIIGISFLVSDLFMLVMSESYISLNFFIAAFVLPIYNIKFSNFYFRSSVSQ